MGQQSRPRGRANCNVRSLGAVHERFPKLLSSRVEPVRTGRWTAVFTKQPSPGRVKTRLVPPLTPAGAAALAEAMLRDTVAKLGASTAFETVLVYDPPSAAEWFAREFAAVRVQRAQRGAELGARLADFVERVFTAHEARALVIVGSDQPLVPLARILEAHTALENGADCVLGPDPGGGYYLVGLAQSMPELFTRVPMSSAGMCAASAALARERGLAVTLLTEHDDVDTAADLVRLRAELAQRGPEEAAYTRRALAALELGA